MNKLSLIAAVAAAGLLAATWSVHVTLSDYASSELEDNSTPPAWHHRPPLLPVVNTLGIHHDARAETLAPRENIALFSIKAYQHYRQHVDERFRRFNSAQQIARECHSTVDYMNRLFRHYGHVSLDQYLAHLKRNQATEDQVNGFGNPKGIETFSPATVSSTQTTTRGRGAD